ncbi:hypothetical protein [Cellulomonas sp. S1-8]|uniref:hypothetical protein n=1 Tax=Cellulomonas sp. S1-8 TaxID=2904790 RepID=UPI0022448E6C|nr:hypothetical protein [Cellulomonas sp. S1-8]UZN03787.1 hypothetical protein OKX07_02265 [Cellulomonas sp. S1-8]
MTGCQHDLTGARRVRPGGTPTRTAGDASDDERRQWLAVGMTDWSRLRDIYGSAAGVPALLDEAASVSDWDAPVWQELWSRLCHQGTVAPASYEALPTLARIAGTRGDVAVDPALFLASAIIASTDGPLHRAEVRRLHATHIDGLRPVAEHKLGLVRARVDVLYALGVVAALDGSVWQRGLTGLADEEIELDCRSCGEHLYLEPADGRLVMTTDADLVDADGSVHPADPAQLGPAETRLVGLCRAHDHAEVETELLQLFGRTRCPSCGAELTLAD